MKENGDRKTRKLTLEHLFDSMVMFANKLDKLLPWEVGSGKIDVGGRLVTNLDLEMLK